MPLSTPISRSFSQLFAALRFWQKRLRETSPLLHSSGNISVLSFFLGPPAILTKFWPAAANATVRLREREHRRTRTRRACLWPCLAGFARPESLRRRGRVCRRLRKLVGAYPTALVWPARLRRTAVGAPAFFRSKRCGIRVFLSPTLESGRSLGWGCGLSGGKVPSGIRKVNENE